MEPTKQAYKIARLELQNDELRQSNHLLRGRIALLEAYLAELCADQMVSVDERLPTEPGYYLVRTTNKYMPETINGIHKAYYYPPEKTFYGDFWVTHWLAIPPDLQERIL